MINIISHFLEAKLLYEPVCPSQTHSQTHRVRGDIYFSVIERLLQVLTFTIILSSKTVNKLRRNMYATQKQSSPSICMVKLCLNKKRIINHLSIYYVIQSLWASKSTSFIIGSLLLSLLFFLYRYLLLISFYLHWS